MSDTATKMLEDRIHAIVERVRSLAAERDALRDELNGLRVRLAETESGAARGRDADRVERENARLRAALEEAIRDLREGAA